MPWRQSFSHQWNGYCQRLNGQVETSLCNPLLRCSSCMATVTESIFAKCLLWRMLWTRKWNKIESKKVSNDACGRRLSFTSQINMFRHLFSRPTTAMGRKQQQTFPYSHDSWEFHSIDRKCTDRPFHSLNYPRAPFSAWHLGKAGS